MTTIFLIFLTNRENILAKVQKTPYTLLFLGEQSPKPWHEESVPEDDRDFCLSHRSRRQEEDVQGWSYVHGSDGYDRFQGGTRYKSHSRNVPGLYNG